MTRSVATLVALLAVCTLVACGGQATETPDAGARHTTAVFLGDSLTAATVRGSGYTDAVATALGWEDVAAGGVGTGYVNPGKTYGSAPYGARVPAVVRLRPDVVVVQGGGNDVGASPVALRSAARQLYADLARELPFARVVVVGPLAAPGVDPAEVAAVRDVLKQAADEAGVPFVDPIAEGWLTPSRGMYSGDKITPTATGFRRMAAQLTWSLRTLGI